ncbi:hypothetical protein DFJ73DRAFT_586847 [Zopfochytrium polystomum]|nr:hypothetical protein DFJ73DRAFT_586847 [Zopfochytrium polystomum]
MAFRGKTWSVWVWGACVCMCVCVCVRVCACVCVCVCACGFRGLVWVGGWGGGVGKSGGSEGFGWMDGREGVSWWAAGVDSLDDSVQGIKIQGGSGFQSANFYLFFFFLSVFVSGGPFCR